mmetsp:Transcript_64421/g.114570  ORF Transcript_64421/g.114570 Transcript_64421/m.114570 type:complete len:1047 (-) Transcript_64421:166-3306(-)
MGKIDEVLENGFEKIGKAVGTHPAKFITASVIVSAMLGYGFSKLESETRPERQWVAKGALALEHSEYVANTWPGASRFNLFTATCADVSLDDCNILDPKYIARFHEINQRIMNITIDGDEIVADLDAAHKKTGSWSQFAGQWTFSGKAVDKNGTVSFDGRKCFSFGPFCGKSSVLDVFRDDENVIMNLDTAGVQQAVNFWEDQEGMCPLSIATANSPCMDDNCQKYNTGAERSACRSLATTYCSTACPTTTFIYQGEEVTVPVDVETCMDRGCIQLGALQSITTAAPDPAMLNTDPNATGNAPESAFEFAPSPMKTMVGSLSGEGNVKYTKGKFLQGYWVINKDELYCPEAGNADPVADEWERLALCELGIDADPRATPKLECPKDDLLEFNGLFGRSFGDEFGAAIRGDIAKLSSSYFVIIIYLGIMIGKRDAIHSGITLSVSAVLIVGLTIASSFGLMGLAGVPNSNLNQNLYFLILGLGVDDAFVLSSEFVRHTTMNPELSIEQRAALTAKTGGISVLITSATDALAFLVGSSTVLPALGWFCTYAGTAIIFCFIFQLTVFLPVLALNARRAEANRRDCICCCKTHPRAIDDPQGCCLCCTPKVCGDDMLRRGLKFAATQATTPPGQAITILIFTIVAAVGLFGSTQVYKDFKLEWFIPDSSYVNEFFNINSEHFASGTQFNVNMRETPDVFEAQSNMRDVFEYLNTTSLVNRDVAVNSWYEEFMEWAVNPDLAETATAVFNPPRSDPRAAFGDRTAFYTALHWWYRNTQGSRYRNNMKWADSDCQVDGTTQDLPAGCDPTEGLKAHRFSAEYTLASTDLGTNRYDTMTASREAIAEKYPGAFPFSRDFLYWEEVGIIDHELVRNLLVCGAVIIVIVAALVPVPRIAVWVIFCIILSVVETLGYMYFWGVTISGVSTIYILICVGLAVDYAAHIAHMFKESSGSSRERAIAAVERIGPCTFNAVFSTFLAVIVVGFSDSYVFRIFFQVLFLVVILAGAHGLWLLPVILSLVGGAKEHTSTAVENVKPAIDAESSSPEEPARGA